MTRLISTLLLASLIMACNTENSERIKNLPTDGPIQLHPDNPHYFLYKGKTLVLITSAELRDKVSQYRIIPWLRKKII